MSTNHEIREMTELLDKRGRLIEPGYAARMNFIYNRECAKSFPCKLKEWNFYQFIKGRYSLQITLGHLTYMFSASAELINLETGEKRKISVMKPFFVPELDRDPEGESFNEYSEENFYLSYQVTADKRLIYLKGKNEQKEEVEIRLTIDNDVENEKMVIATPFRNPKQFYLNYKENYYSGTGEVQFGDLTVDFDGCTGLVDWGRGIWPYRHEWFWGNLTGHIDDVPFGFNIGWGFGDLSHATENMYFYNKKAYKVGRLLVKRDKDDYMQPWMLKDEEGKMKLIFTPIYNHYTENKFKIIDTHCNQVYGLFSGVIETEDGPKKFREKLAFIEHAVNRW